MSDDVAWHATPLCRLTRPEAFGESITRNISSIKRCAIQRFKFSIACNVVSPDPIFFANLRRDSDANQMPNII